MCLLTHEAVLILTSDGCLERSSLQSCVGGGFFFYRKFGRRIFLSHLLKWGQSGGATRILTLVGRSLAYGFNHCTISPFVAGGGFLQFLKKDWYPN
jgi:hypothetical protein